MGFYNESIPVKAVKVPGKILEFLFLSGDIDPKQVSR